jgi:hypothetical protein
MSSKSITFRRTGCILTFRTLYRHKIELVFQRWCSYSSSSSSSSSSSYSSSSSGSSSYSSSSSSSGGGVGITAYVSQPNLSFEMTVTEKTRNSLNVRNVN